MTRLIPSLAHPAQSLSEPKSPLASEAAIRVVLVISSKLERLGWSIVLENQDDMQLLGQFAVLDDALAFLAANSVDVVLIDEALLTPKYCEVLRRGAAHRRSRFLLVTKHPLDEGLERSRYSFVSDFLLKGVSAADLLSSIRGPGRNWSQR